MLRNFLHQLFIAKMILKISNQSCKHKNNKNFSLKHEGNEDLLRKMAASKQENKKMKMCIN
jgi:hypothetical protein